MSARKLPWLIAYDIRSPARLRRLHRWLTRHAAPVQYSVFLGRYDREQIDWICRQIRSIIDEREDDVRLYPVPDAPKMHTLGRQRCPMGWGLIEALKASAAGAGPLGVPAPRRKRGRPRQATDPEGESTPEQSEPMP